jgi:DNA-binding transcriptional ArsR family regulator
MANAKRLMVLCNLLLGEQSVGQLAQLVDLSQAALSQHLAKMRALNLVATRRDGQTIYYRLASQEVREVLETLYRLYCT